MTDDLTHRRVDALANALEAGRPLDASAPLWSGLDEAQARTVGQLLFERLGADTTDAWKLGAIDQETQRALGITGPVVAPLLPGSVRTGVHRTTIQRDHLVQPRFEAEIGVHLGGDQVLAVPCVEVAACRFDGWQLPPGGVYADIGLQGTMLFGDPQPPPDSCNVTVAVDGDVVATGTARWDDILPRLDLLPPGHGATHVATGAVTPLVDVEPGTWTFSFDGLGRLEVVVT